MPHLLGLVFQCMDNERKMIINTIICFSLRISSPSRLPILGKTTILYQLNLNEQVTTIPTFGFDVVLQGDAEIMLSKLGPKIHCLAWYLSVYIVIH